MIKRTDVTYSELDKVLRSFGFTCQTVVGRVESRRYDHQPSGAVILLPAFPEKDKVLDYHLLGVRITLDEFGIADAAEFAAKLKKAG